MGSNSKSSLLYHHFGWAFQSSANTGVYKGRPIAFKTRYFDFTHLSKTKKHPWDRIPRARFQTTILGVLFQAAQKAGLTKVVQLRSKRFISTFPIGAKRKNTLGIEFYEVGFIPLFWVGFSKQRKKPGWRKSSNCVKNALFWLSPSGQNKKTPFRSNFTRSVLYHHFGWAFLSSAKSRVYKGCPIAFKTLYFDFPHRGETKKHPWDRILRGRFHTTFLGKLFKAAQKAGLTKVVQLRSKRIEAKRIDASRRNEKTPLGSNSRRSVSYHHFGLAFPTSAKSRVDKSRQIAFKTRYFDFPHRGETKKHPLDRIPQDRFYTSLLGGLLQAAQKGRLIKVVQSRSKRVFSFFPSLKDAKTHLASNPRRSVSCHHFGWSFTPVLRFYCYSDLQH